MSSARARLFVALEVPVAIQRVLASRARSLAALDSALRPVAESAIHLTIKFLGDVERARVPDVLAALARGVLGLAPARLELVGLGAFPKPAVARVVWVGVRDGQPLVSLAARVEAELEGLGFAREERPFHPHVTLGRLRAGARHPALANALAAATEESAGEFLASAVSLFESELAPAGARYSLLGSVPFPERLGASLA